jgi:hypothetical protein
MRWGENKNVHPKHGTDVASVVPPNLGCCKRQPHSPGSITGAARRRYFELWTHFALRLGGPFSIDLSRRFLSTINPLSGAIFNAYLSSSLPCRFW